MIYDANKCCIIVELDIPERMRAMTIIPRIDPEFKNLIPPLLPEERAQLEENILTDRKCHDGIVVWDGTIIDGHNRFEICVKHGIEFQIIKINLPSREAAKLWILENQLGKRNLTDAMRIELALVKADMIRKKAKKKQSRAGGDKKSAKSEGPLITKVSKPKDEPMLVNKIIAKEAGVSQGTLQSYMEIKKDGSPELIARVQSGEIKIGTARRLLAKEVLKQINLCEKMLKFIADVFAASRDIDGHDEFRREINERMLRIADKLNELMDALDKKASGSYDC